MKKLLFAVIILFPLLFCSCFHGNPKPEYQDPAVKSITVNTYTDGPVYLNKLNISSLKKVNSTISLSNIKTETV